MVHKYNKLDYETYRLTHTEYDRERSKKYYYDNKEKFLEQQKEYRSTPEYKQKMRIYQRERSRKLRNQLIIILGGKCVKCGFSETICLQFDHINDDGNAERKILGNRSNSLPNYYNKRPELAKERLQLLCANCHIKKHTENTGYIKSWVFDTGLDNEVAA